ncbi:TIGR03085 family metal-binding protein [Isoptericola sp. NPDC055881]
MTKQRNVQVGWAVQEREDLVRTFRSADPDAPTLCEGWDTRRLLAHLTQREQMPWGRVADAISRKPAGHEPGLDKLTAQAMTGQGYAAMIDRFAHGAPRWSLMRWAGDQLNTLEFHIHHEDIRRAGATVEPRVLSDAQQDALWHRLGMFARLGLRRSPVAVRLETPAGQSRTVRAGEGVTLIGEPLELALWVTGRRGPARVTLTGDSEPVGRFRAWAVRS